MANRFVSPDQQFISFAGIPYEGGFLYFYVSGTSTPATTYQDQALTIPNLNPVELDSAGNAGNVFLNSLVVYKVVLEDANHNQIWTFDPVIPTDASQASANNTIISCTANGTNSLVLTPLVSGQQPSAYTNFMIFAFVPLNTTTGDVIAQVGTLPDYPVFEAPGLQAGAGSFVGGSGPYLIAYGSTVAGSSPGFLMLNNARETFTAALPGPVPPSGGNSSQYLNGAGSFSVPLGASGVANNLVVKNDTTTPNTKIDLSASSIVMLNGASVPILNSSGAGAVIDLTTNGVNGMDTGSRPANGWVNLFFITDGTNLAGLASLSATAPLLPVVLGGFAPGSGYVNGSYTNVPLTGGSGTGATANITVSGGVVSGITLVLPGSNYVTGDVLSAANSNLGGTGSGFTVNIASSYSYFYRVGTAWVKQSLNVRPFLQGANFTQYKQDVSQEILTLGSITGGSSYVNGSYTNVPLTGGTGSGATANITVSGGAITVVTLVLPGTRYVVGDTLSAANSNLGGTGSGFSIPVATIINPGVPIMRQASEGSITSPTYVSFSIQKYVPPTARRIIGSLNIVGAGDAILAPNGSYGAISSTSNPPPVGGPVASGAATFTMVYDFLIENQPAASLFWASNASNNCVLGRAYIDSVNAN